MPIIKLTKYGLLDFVIGSVLCIGISYCTQRVMEGQKSPEPIPTSAIIAEAIARVETRSPTETPTLCKIKGMIVNGWHVYILPGDPAYVDFQVDESMGMRWFCSEYDANAHGWDYLDHTLKTIEARQTQMAPIATKVYYDFYRDLQKTRQAQILKDQKLEK